MLLVDAHLDLSMNALEWNRDLRWSVDAIRKSEEGMTDKKDRGNNTVSLHAMRKGNMGLCVATQIARYVRRDNPLPGWHSPEQAWAQTQGQLAWYRAMEEAGEMGQIRNAAELDAHLKAWNEDPETTPIGYVLSLEGADSMVTLDHVERSYEQGLRAMGPAHYGPGTYAQGTDAEGGIGQVGRDLLKELERLNIILDATHLCDESFREAMDHFGGNVWASHSNCRALVPDHRQFTDEQMKELIERGAVIGAALDAWMLVPNWIKRKSTVEELHPRLEHMVDNIDRVCQLAGNSEHAAIGTDLDGGFGTEQSPEDLDTIGDVQKIFPMLEARGYKAEDMENIAWKNWVRFLKRVWA
ncbi:membrane dipeptidase [Opitutia bacterium ISCC 51]|nr:membrane dipeptidase [Opitutae bacterium ISCC 51]QXD27642.1 membrane dipeptidase [Opitutae bacterium ISCC 52]